MPRVSLSHPVDNRLDVLQSESWPVHKEAVDLIARESDVLWRSHDALEMLFEIQPHAHLASIPHDEGGALGWGLHPMAPRQLKVRNQEPVTAFPTETSLECHKNPGGMAVACDALSQHQLNPRDDPAPYA